MNRYFIYLGYNGKEYCGWQIQPNGMTVQQRLEESLSTILRSKIAVVGAGRTDAGVHARRMVAHFEMEQPLTDLSFLTDKLNRILPPDIAVYKIVPVVPDAHARFDAVSRTYRYYLTLHKNPFNFNQVYRYHSPLDFERMKDRCSAGISMPGHALFLEDVAYPERLFLVEE